MYVLNVTTNHSLQTARSNGTAVDVESLALVLALAPVWSSLVQFSQVT